MAVLVGRALGGNPAGDRHEARLSQNGSAPFKTGGLMDLNDIEQKVSQSGGELTELKAAVKQLQARVDRHALVIQALKDLLLARGDFSEAEFPKGLEQAVAQKAAGKNCRKCGKALNARQNRCLYCGEERPPELL
jgi:hypothetical protein